MSFFSISKRNKSTPPLSSVSIHDSVTTAAATTTATSSSPSLSSISPLQRLSRNLSEYNDKDNSNSNSNSINNSDRNTSPPPPPSPTSILYLSNLETDTIVYCWSVFLYYFLTPLYFCGCFFYCFLLKHIYEALFKFKRETSTTGKPKGTILSFITKSSTISLSSSPPSWLSSQLPPLPLSRKYKYRFDDIQSQAYTIV